MVAAFGRIDGTGSPDDINIRLNFFKKLQAVTNKIHSTSHVDEIMLDMSKDVCELFNSERLTIYAVTSDRTSIVSKVKTGLNSINQLKLPISDKSVAGYVALNRKLINICDVYDDAELRSYSPELHFLREVDHRTGYRTKQMLIAPIIDELSNELLGVVQLPAACRRRHLRAGEDTGHRLHTATEIGPTGTLKV